MQAVGCVLLSPSTRAEGAEAMPQHLCGPCLFVPEGERSNAQDFGDSSQKLMTPSTTGTHTPAFPSLFPVFPFVCPLHLISVTSRIWERFSQRCLGEPFPILSPSAHTLPEMGAPFLPSPQLSRGLWAGCLLGLWPREHLDAGIRTALQLQSVSLALIQFNSCS